MYRPLTPRSAAVSALSYTVLLASSVNTATAGNEGPKPLSAIPSMQSDNWDAACTALELNGIAADPRDFIAARYVSQCGGSTPEEVARVVRDAGGNARILSRLSATDLRLVRCPVIANVRSTMTSSRFNHWVAVVPNSRGVTVYDGTNPPIEVSTAAFLGSWSGIGICVTADEANPLTSIWLGRSAMLLTVGVVAIGLWRKCSSVARWTQPRVVAQLAGLFGVSVALCLAGNAAFGDWRHHTEGVAVATAPFRSNAYRHGTLEDVRRAAASEDMLLVDARRAADFRLGAIERAINIPVSASYWSISKYLEPLDRGVPIVVYCQSARCDYDETVAAQIVSLGFSDVTVCDEGWAEFQQKSASIQDP